MQKLSVIFSMVGVAFLITGFALPDDPESSVALRAIFSILGGCFALAGGVAGIVFNKPSLSKETPPDPAEEPKPAAMPPASEPTPKGIPTDGLVLVSLLQEKGRFLDFLMDDISAYSDAQVGAAARIIHQGCKSVITDAFAPTAIATTPERSAFSLPADFGKATYRVTGELTGEPPYTVTLEHKGWKPTQCILPEFQGELSSADEYVFAPAQVTA